MVYAIVYVEHADVVEDFESYSEAKAAIEELISDHPDVAHRVGILPLDDDGRPGEFEPAVDAGAVENPLLAVCEA